MWRRRSVLSRAVATTVTTIAPATLLTVQAASGLGLAPNDKHGIGVNAWTLRNQLGRSPADILKRVVDIGIDKISFYDIASTEAAVKLSRGLGLKPVGLHFWSLFEADGSWAAWSKGGTLARIPGFAPEFLARAAQRHGFSYVVSSGDPPTEACRNQAAAERYCDVIGHVGRALRSRGVRFLYHAHFPEFEDLGGGRTLFDLLIQRTDAADVGFEPDTFWLTHVGRDPVTTIAQLGHRAEIVYIRDRLRGAAPVRPPHPEPSNDSHLHVPVGLGGIELQAILRACREAGVQHLFLEDEAPVQPIASLTTSLANLRPALETL
jgi:sugar phosphate isomerase/epimerase